MRLTKLYHPFPRWTACTLAVAVALAGAAAAWGDEPPVKNGEALKQLLQTRFDVAQKVFDLRMQQFRAGTIGIDLILRAQKQLLMAELDLRDKKDDRVSVCQKNVNRAADARKVAEVQRDAGQLGMADYLQAEYEWQDAKVLLEREKMK